MTVRRGTAWAASMALALTTLTAASGRDAPPRAPVARFAWFSYRGDDAPLAAGHAPGRYANPILAGFHPDPSAIRVGDWYYLVTSSFTYFPGLPVLRSRDLVHWTRIGSAIDRPGMVDFTGLGLSRGLFAPAIAHHGGLFYLVNTCVDCGGNFVVTARDPAGPWSDPVWLRDVGGIDPSLFVDDDGSAWLMNNDAPEGGSTYEGHRAIWIRRFDLAHLRTAGPAHMIVNGGVDISQHPIWAEGPHILRHDGRYYLYTAEGGTAVNHSEVVYRSDRPDGPYVPRPEPILTQRDLDPARADPITSAGHATILDTPKGAWWATFLATRPYAGDLYNTGRETFLLPVTWTDGWPVILPPRTPIPYAPRRPDLPTGTAPTPLGGNYAVRDDFAGPRLAPGWSSVRVPATRWWHLGGGALSLDARPARIGEAGQPSFLGRPQAHLDAVAETQVAFDAPPGGKAGLVAYQDEAHYYFVGVANDGGRRVVRVERRVGAGDPVDGAVLAARPLPAGAVRLRVEAHGARYAFSYAPAGGGWRPLLADADGTILSTHIAGGFVGTMLGPYAYAPENERTTR